MAAKRRPALPASVKVGARSFPVLDHQATDEPNPDAIGSFYSFKGFIHVDPGMKPDYEAVVFLHELLHAIYWDSGLRDILGLEDEEEEIIVNSLSLRLAALIRDNPAILTYLSRALS